MQDMNTYLPQSSPVHYYTEARHEIKGALCAPRKIVGVLHVTSPGPKNKSLWFFGILHSFRQPLFNGNCQRVGDLAGVMDLMSCFT